ncbi:carboxylesterase/lipase family protein [Actinomadura rayongensis]|uniref:Carboxylic ester hydrolase n=1 Tax=Actinomadura rayongensis TaxID=1429076 RepID=A0A6I4W4D5_9ACTN|nr:carboxylesterase family protein [Actinomadura rayongensis]MXQ63285.1 carboxylesterase family protein [Actinomadura rayongensis]
MESAVVRTAYGLVRGTLRDGVSSYLGIPYAAPPFGPNRFRPPQPPEPWDGVRDATAYGPTAPKPGYAGVFRTLLPDPDIPGDDCLNLNVWTPDPGAAGLPVLVWIHGGAFRNGSGAVGVYDGSAFARDGVVCVTINYRLGVEGFAHLPGVPDNRGLRDQIAALEWVRDNIAAFGGDPARVTVAGESAGAMSVATLLSLDLGLFRRAVAQSGAAQIAQAPADALRVTAEIAARLGIPPTAEAFAALPPGKILPVQDAVGNEISMLPAPDRWGPTTAASGIAFMPVLDGDVFPRRADEAIEAGAGRDVDVLVGHTRDEFNLYVVPNGLIDHITDDLFDLVTSGLGVSADVLAAHSAAGTPGERLCAVVTDHMFRRPAHRLARGHAGRTWMYEFAWPSPVHDLGACHALELGFVFDTLASPHGRPLTGDDPPQPLADAMHGAWVSFAADGDPGWAPYDAVRTFA